MTRYNRPFRKPTPVLVVIDVGGPVTWFGFVHGLGYVIERGQTSELLGNLDAPVRDRNEDIEVTLKEFHSDEHEETFSR